MQNKGLVRIFTIALTLVCLFYLSFSFVTSYYGNKAVSYAANKVEIFNANGDKTYDEIEDFRRTAEYHYLDSMGYESVWLTYTLKECREREIGLGLDLKGGMNVILEVSVSDILKALSNHNTTPNFTQALQVASERQQTNSQITYLDLFVQAYNELDSEARLATIFSTFEMKDKISLSSSNDDVVKVLRTEVDDAISNSFNVLRTRIDRFGVVQPNLQRLGNTGRILVELPGVKEPERVRKLLQGSANLEFWETYELSEIYNNISEANRVLYTIQAANQAASEETVWEQNLPQEEVVQQQPVSALDSLTAALGSEGLDSSSDVANAAAQAQYEKENPLFAVLSPAVHDGQIGRGPVVGYAQGRDTAKVNAYFNTKQVREVLPRDLGLRWSVKAIDEKSDIYQLIAIKIANRDGRAPLAGNVITDARADFAQNSSSSNVSMSMNAEGAKIWARMTKENIGKSIAIALDGLIYSFPTVNAEITGGSSQISGNFTVNEAKDLANTLKSGKMPAPTHIVQEDVIGPSLGQQAVQSGLISFIIAFILILLYMIFYYGLIPGLIADLALFANVFFLMGILASFGAVLTLPGIAGIVLTLGMAVDGNVLIYERIREEMRAGKNLKRAIEEGFSNAISAIIDANVTTFMTGVILMTFGTGPIQGFATTLVIGTVTSFITSVFLTRSMLQWYANRENAKELPFTTSITKNWLQNLHFNFIGNRKIGYFITCAMIAICFISFGVRGLSLGIDFSGGHNYVVRFDQPVQTEEVRSLLGDAFEEASAQVISIGSADQVRVSTKYKINDNSPTVVDEMETILFENLQPFINNNTVTKELFVKGYIIDQDGTALLATDKNKTSFGIQSSQKVGPTIADDIKRAAIFSIILAILAIGLYVFIRFREFGYSLGAIAGLTQDAIVTMGLYSLFYNILPFSMEIDQSFVAAILTVVGYSVNDKVVIFDRIRENVRLYPKRDRKTVINDSINATLSRTFSTSMSTLVVLIAIFAFGGETIRGFIFAMMFGVIIGTYSSIFIAAPVAYGYYIRKNKIEEEKIEEKK